MMRWSMASSSKCNGFGGGNDLVKNVTTLDSLCKHVYVDVSSSRDWMLIVLSTNLIN
jgi:hypothetical protein